MAVYVDEAIWYWQGLKWCHLLADDANELHRFAARLGLKRTSFQSPPEVTVPHYDLTAYERVRAIATGAVACDRHQIVAVLRRIRRCAAQLEFGSSADLAYGPGRGLKLAPLATVSHP
jgi:Protein of unknown function (DUF4031)